MGVNVSSGDCSAYACWSKGMVEQCPKKKVAQLNWRRNENTVSSQKGSLQPDVTKQGPKSWEVSSQEIDEVGSNRAEYQRKIQEGGEKSHWGRIW